jgi:MoxR-like ATPase
MQRALADAHAVARRLTARLGAAVKGRDDVIELLVVALLADGHVLLEDYPGSGKTTLARVLGTALAAPDGAATGEGAPAKGDAAPDRSPGVSSAIFGIAPFRRIQFTPDLLPSDITGTNVFDPHRNAFEFRRGPIFAHVLLADEINRTSPKVQAALLEAMAEKQVTVDDATYPLDALFFVIATQNPLDVAGTYPLPAPQLDRFLFKIRMTHITRDAEIEVLAAYPDGGLARAAALPGVTRAELLAARHALRHEVALVPAVREALVDLARALRADPRVVQGVSTRSLVLMLPALQARALLRERDFVGPEDVEALAPHVFAHRIEFTPGTEDPRTVLREHVGACVEKLARLSLRS